MGAMRDQIYAGINAKGTCIHLITTGAMSIIIYIYNIRQSLKRAGKSYAAGNLIVFFER